MVTLVRTPNPHVTLLSSQLENLTKVSFKAPVFLENLTHSADLHIDVLFAKERFSIDRGHSITI